MKKTVLLLLCLSALTAQAADGYMSLDSCRWMTNTHTPQGNPTGQVLD